VIGWIFYIIILKYFNKLFLKVGAKFVNPWFKKIMVGQIILLNFFKKFKNILKIKGGCKVC